MALLGTLRLSQDQIRQIIAEHLSAKHGIGLSPERVDLWPAEDQYGTSAYALVDLTEHLDALRSKG